MTRREGEVVRKGDVADETQRRRTRRHRVERKAREGGSREQRRWGELFSASTEGILGE